MKVPLKNPKHEDFAKMVASGVPEAEAYRRAGFARWNAEMGGRRLRADESVARRIADLGGGDPDTAPIPQPFYQSERPAAAGPSAERFGRGKMELPEMMEWLAEVARGRPVPPTQLKAAELLCLLSGWTVPGRNLSALNSADGEPDSFRIASYPPGRAV